MAELTGKAISELPAATTINDTDLLALSQNGASKKITPPVLLSGVESEISGLNSSLATYVRPNLLDNWYFVGGGSQRGDGVFPINQRGQASYTNGWSIDRWQIPSTINMTLSLSGITITNTNATTRYSALQPLNSLNNLRGKTVTGSILLAGGTLYSGSVSIPSDVPSSTTNIPIVAVGSWAELRLENRSDGIIKMSITMTASQSLMIQAIKLEIGDTQTLAHQSGNTWVLNEIPDYVEQLAKCQRYFERIKGAYSHFGTGFANTATNAFMYVPVKEKAKTPTVTLSGTIYVWQPGVIGGSAATCTTIADYNMTNGANMLYLTLPTSGLTQSAPCGAQFRDSASYIDVSAES